MNIASKTLSYEISTMVQSALEGGRCHLNDEEASYLLKISQKLIEDYLKELEKLPDN